MMLWTLLIPLAIADIPPPQNPSTAPLHHELIIQGLDAHPEHVLLITPQTSNGMISTSRVLSHDTPQVFMAKGDASSSQIWQPVAQWMSRDDYDQWRLEVTQIIEEQRKACDERGEGCPHISRFEPSYSPPKTGIVCTLDLPELDRETKIDATDSPKPWPDPQVKQHVFSLTDVSEETCVLSPVNAENTTNPLNNAETKWATLAPATGVSGLLIGTLLLRSRRFRAPSDPSRQ